MTELTTTTSTATITNGNPEIHLFFNKPVSLTGSTSISVYSGSTNITNPNQLPFVNTSTDKSDVIIPVSSSFIEGNTYTVYVGGVIPSTGVTPEAPMATSFVYQSSPIIR